MEQITEESLIFDFLCIIGAIAIIILAFFIYFIPTHIAFSKEHKNKIAILIMNLLFGFTGIGWLIVFIWACSYNHIKIGQTPTIAQEIKELAELKKKGIITEEEFNNKKTQLLNSDTNTKETE